MLSSHNITKPSFRIIRKRLKPSTSRGQVHKFTNTLPCLIVFIIVYIYVLKTHFIVPTDAHYYKIIEMLK